jgi:hypothetical protein
MDPSGRHVRGRRMTLARRQSPVAIRTAKFFPGFAAPVFACPFH